MMRIHLEEELDNLYSLAGKEDVVLGWDLPTWLLDLNCTLHSETAKMQFQVSMATMVTWRQLQAN